MTVQEPNSRLLRCGAEWSSPTRVQHLPARAARPRSRTTSRLNRIWPGVGTGIGVLEANPPTTQPRARGHRLYSGFERRTTAAITTTMGRAKRKNFAKTVEGRSEIKVLPAVRARCNSVPVQTCRIPGRG